MKKFISFAVILILVSVEDSRAEVKFGGVEVGYIKHSFDPHYTSPNGDFIGQFENKSEGLEYGLVGGYLFSVTERLSIETYARATRNNSEWTLYLDFESASFKYENPYTLGVGITPIFKLSEKVNVFTEFGVLYGKINQRKHSSEMDRSSYNFSDWVNGISIGAGMSYQLTPSVQCRLSYRKSKFDELSYRSYFPSGEHAETIKDEPNSKSISISLVYQF